MSTRDPRVDAYIARSADFAKPILRHIRELVHRGCPEAQETMKWSFPHFQHKGMLCSMASFKQHCSFGFWKAKLLEKQTAAEVRTGESKDGMGNFGRLTSLADLPSDAAIVALVRRAVELNDQGVTRPRPKPGKKKPLRMPSEFAAALKQNSKARACFEAFSPSHKREYLQWIIEAKTAETRARRIAEAMGWIAKGKHRNWKYERC
jgi:uncharacterized protein YdeI (YjbR/CyaY-like superfamily)